MQPQPLPPQASPRQMPPLAPPEAANTPSPTPDHGLSALAWHGPHAAQGCGLLQPWLPGGDRHRCACPALLTHPISASPHLNVLCTHRMIDNDSHTLHFHGLVRNPETLAHVLGCLRRFHGRCGSVRGSKHTTCYPYSVPHSVLPPSSEYSTELRCRVSCHHHC